jgi:hypothetical protein
MATSADARGPAAPPLPTWRRWGARAALAVALLGAGWFAFRTVGATYELHAVYLLADDAAGMTALDVAWLAAGEGGGDGDSDGARLVRAKSWSFDAAHPAPRALEDVLTLAGGPYRVELAWTAPAGRRFVAIPVLLGDSAPAAPVVLTLPTSAPAPPGAPLPPH